VASSFTSSFTARTGITGARKFSHASHSILTLPNKQPDVKGILERFLQMSLGVNAAIFSSDCFAQRRKGMRTSGVKLKESMCNRCLFRVNLNRAFQLIVPIAATQDWVT
jgi:hypothetical protein